MRFTPCVRGLGLSCISGWNVGNYSGPYGVKPTGFSSGQSVARISITVEEKDFSGNSIPINRHSWEWMLIVRIYKQALSPLTSCEGDFHRRMLLSGFFQISFSPHFDLQVPNPWVNSCQTNLQNPHLTKTFKSIAHHVHTNPPTVPCLNNYMMYSRIIKL